MTYQIAAPIESVITEFYRPPEARKGDRSDLLWWVCPFHDKDDNPSLCVEPGKSHYHCFGCDAHGDAIDFVRDFKGITFREAVQAIEGEAPRRQEGRPPRPQATARKAERVVADTPEGWRSFARELVGKAEDALWSDVGAGARAYLKGRGITEQTAREARLGFIENGGRRPCAFQEKGVWVPQGIVIPWFDGTEVAAVKFRLQPDDPQRYSSLSGGQNLGLLYPGPAAIKVGKPLIVVEGELDALLLGQELRGLAPVVTLGGASATPRRETRRRMLMAPWWVIAVDADGAGEKNAETWMSDWPNRCTRIAPPDGFGKDWTDALKNGLDVRSWWATRLDEITRGPAPTTPPEAQQAPPVSLPAVERPGPATTPLPWRGKLVGAPIEFRQAWGRLSEKYELSGVPWPASEERAFAELSKAP